MDIFKILGTIAIDSSAANKAMDNAAQKAEKTHSKISSAFSKIGEGAVWAGKQIAKGLAVGAAAMTTLTIKSLDLVGELEQNMGGAEAVFAECAANMKSIAQDAYSNMGLSASDYLATANKMGALFKGAGFEIQEASDLTAKAMQRAADVASIMGIDVSSAMESIAGAAKGNFTMMDNLGVAMNDTNLQAYALSKGIETATSEMTTQEKIGLAMEMFLEKTAYAAGNYAKENETLSGSLTTAKAALKNFLSGVGDASTLADALVNSGYVITEKLQELLPNLTTGIGQLLQKLIPKIPPLLRTLLPSIVQGTVSLLNGLASAAGEIAGALGSIFPALVDGVVSIVDNLAQKLPDILQALLPSLTSGAIKLAAGLVKTLVTRLPEMLWDALVAVGESLVAAWDTIFGVLKKDVAGLTESQRDLHNQVMESKEAFDELCDAYNDNAYTIKQETERTQDLWAELQTLCDENGNVKDAYKDRAAYIAHELSEATGLEIELIDGTISKYGELKQSIEDTIEMRQAERMLSAHEDKVTEAEAQIGDAKSAMSQEYANVQAKQDAAAAAERDRDAFLARNAQYIQQWNEDGSIIWTDKYTPVGLAEEYNVLQSACNSATAELKEATKAYNESKDTYLELSDEIRIHKEAEAAILAGNYELAIQILNDEVTAQWEALAQRQELSAAEKARLAGDLEAAEAFAQSLVEEYKAGNASVTKEMVDEALKQADTLRAIWEGAYGETFNSGAHLGEGLAAGLESKIERVAAASRKIAAKAMGAINETLQIASPSKAAKRSGKFTAEGLALGLEENENIPVSAAESVAWKTLKAFDQGNPHIIPTVNAVGGMDSLSEIAESGAGNNSSGSVDPIVAALPGKLADALAQILPDMLIEAFSSMRLSINDREFGRLVRKAGT